MTRFYAVYEIPSSSLAVEDSITVLAFSTRRDRDRYVAWLIDLDHQPLLTHGGQRRAITREEAAAVLRQIMQSVYGGRQSGYAALGEVRPEPGPCLSTHVEELGV
jgi:hypothetical protein